MIKRAGNKDVEGRWTVREPKGDTWTLFEARDGLSQSTKRMRGTAHENCADIIVSSVSVEPMQSTMEIDRWYFDDSSPMKPSLSPFPGSNTLLRGIGRSTLSLFNLLYRLQEQSVMYCKVHFIIGCGETVQSHLYRRCEYPHESSTHAPIFSGSHWVEYFAQWKYSLSNGPFITQFRRGKTLHESALYQDENLEMDMNSFFFFL
ncbi:hypothetical protein M501DRAFT_759379 [Patellaria atrata CBS 101060]|uniref:Uncharacterized protein n=1 Tax=Patellaria atrata CBS 101060 TaxID=1346257 RepID=A0A9P4VR65_9PEZI|nr:hypothetical protein M501DRAFT_759379 [Patellaria atrata CBS 101060]